MGIVGALALSWLTEFATSTFIVTIQEQPGDLAIPGLILLGLGLLLGLIGVGGRAHPLVPGVSAIWFTVVFGPSLVGMAGPPDWYPDFMSSFFIRSASPAAYVMLGYLAVTTGVALLRWRRKWLFR